jgi:hypothetical protein
MVQQVRNIHLKEHPDRVDLSLNKNEKFLKKSMYVFLEKTLASAHSNGFGL